MYTNKAQKCSWLPGSPRHRLTLQTLYCCRAFILWTETFPSGRRRGLIRINEIESHQSYKSPKAPLQGYISTNNGWRRPPPPRGLPAGRVGSSVDRASLRSQGRVHRFSDLCVTHAGSPGQIWGELFRGSPVLLFRDWINVCLLQLRRSHSTAVLSLLNYSYNEFWLILKTITF